MGIFKNRKVSRVSVPVTQSANRHPFGILDGYLYIGPPNPDLTAAEDGEYITCLGEKYRIDRAEKVYKGDEVFYIWAIIRVIVEID